MDPFVPEGISSQAFDSPCLPILILGLRFSFGDRQPRRRPYPNLSCKKELPSHCDKEEEAKLDAAMGEFDIEKRRKLVQELMALNHENAANLFFTELTDLSALHRRVQGFKNTIQRFNFHEITLSN